MAGAPTAASEELVVRVNVEVEQTGPHEWHAHVDKAPGIEVRGGSRDEVLIKARALALRRLADEAEKHPTELNHQFQVDCSTFERGHKGR